MRGLLVFTESPEQIVFYSVDRELEYYIRRKYEEKTGPLPDQSATAEDDTLGDSLDFFFLPLVGRFSTLQSLGKPLTSIYAGDNLLIVFNQFDNHVFIAVNDEETESEEILMRKLHAFNRILSTLYGQFKHKMTPPNLQQRKAEWQKLESLLKTYEMLYSQEPSFLVEAIEHINFGQLITAQNLCVALAKDCLSSQNNGGISNVNHAMLLAGAKVLAVYDRSSQLPTADTLMLILMVANRYHHNSPQSSTLASGTQRAASTLPHWLMRTHENSLDISLSKSGHFSSGDDEEYEEKEDGVGCDTLSKYQDWDTFGSLLNVETDVQKSDGQKYFEQNVFLQLNEGMYFPHTLHCIELSPSIILVLVSETLDYGELMLQFTTITQQILDTDSSGYSKKESFEKLEKTIRDIFDIGKTEDERPTNPNLRRKMTLASHLSELISQVMVHLLHMVSERGVYLAAESCDTLEENIRNLVKAGKAEAKRFKLPNLKQRMVKLSKMWGSFCEYGAMMAGPAGEDTWQTKVFGEAQNIFEHLKTLFMELYSSQNRHFNVKVTASLLERHFSHLSKGYGDHLACKAVINLPLVTFQMTYPGIVHFTFVDRSFDELTSPSIVDDCMSNSHRVAYLANEYGKTPGDFLREKVWAMVQRAQKYLKLGNTSQTWLDTEFQYTYYLMSINAVNPKLTGNSHQLVSAVNVWAQEEEPLGVLSGNFYRDITGTLFSHGFVYELYCIHEANISLEAVTLQCENLALQLWQNTKQALTPFQLKTLKK